MAGLSGRNTKIAPSRLGCRLPFESVAVGDGYAAAGKCDSRQMTPEERARYGPPVPREEDNPFRSRFRQAIKVSKSPEQAAELLGMTVGKLNQYLGANGIHPRWNKRKEDETVSDIQENLDDSRENLDTIVQAGTESQENQASGVDEKQGDLDKVVQGQPKFYEGSSSAHRFTSERIAQAEELLSREEYIRLKNEGVSDQKIIKDREKFHYELLTALKKKWGVNIRLSSGPPRPQAKPEPAPVTIKPGQPEEPEEEPRVHAPASGLTIAQALSLGKELAEDIDCITSIIDAGTRGEDLTERVYMMLNFQRGVHQAALDRINEAFEKTVLPL